MFFLEALLSALALAANVHGQSTTALPALVLQPSTAGAAPSPESPSPSTEPTSSPSPSPVLAPSPTPDVIAKKEPDVVVPDRIIEPTVTEIFKQTSKEPAHDEDDLPEKMKLVKNILEKTITLDDDHLKVLNEILPLSIEVARLVLHHIL